MVSLYFLSKCIRCNFHSSEIRCNFLWNAGEYNFIFYIIFVFCFCYVHIEKIRKLQSVWFYHVLLSNWWIIIFAIHNLFLFIFCLFFPSIYVLVYNDIRSVFDSLILLMLVAVSSSFSSSLSLYASIGSV